MIRKMDFSALFYLFSVVLKLRISVSRSDSGIESDILHHNENSSLWNTTVPNLKPLRNKTGTSKFRIFSTINDTFDCFCK